MILSLSHAALGRKAANPTVGSSTPQLTRTGAISGTPSYVAPELARATARITPAVDVFSFGVVAYRLLTGEQPHHEAPLLACLDGREPPAHASLSGECPELPARVATLIDACLAFTPEMRPSTSELLRALDGAARSVDAQILTKSSSRAYSPSRL